MIDVVFSEGAAGSLKSAIASGRFDGEDVLCLPLCLHIGSIDEENFWEKRIRVLGKLYSVYPDGADVAEAMIQQAAEDLQTFEARITAGEDVRIWTSRSPDDASGYVWFGSRLNILPSHGSIHSVHLPWFEQQEDGSIVMRSGCHEIDADTWQTLTVHETSLPATLCAMMQYEWNELQQENAPLRALINGRLVSVPETFYDFLILREIACQPEAFNEAVAIGRLLGEYQLGISDAWLAMRFEAMVSCGWLDVVTPAPPDGPIYHRTLRKQPPLLSADTSTD